MILAQDRYLETKVLTANPQQLHLMVVDGAIRTTRAAIEAIDANDLEQMFDRLSEARDFVAELIGGLQPDDESPMITSLKALFAFAYRNLAEADHYRDRQRAMNALSVLEHHRDTWRELMEATGGSSSVPAPHITRGFSG